MMLHYCVAFESGVRSMGVRREQSGEGVFHFHLAMINVAKIVLFRV